MVNLSTNSTTILMKTGGKTTTQICKIFLNHILKKNMAMIVNFQASLSALSALAKTITALADKKEVARAERDAHAINHAGNKRTTATIGTRLPALAIDHAIDQPAQTTIAMTPFFS